MRRSVRRLEAAKKVTKTWMVFALRLARGYPTPLPLGVMGNGQWVVDPRVPRNSSSLESKPIRFSLGSVPPLSAVEIDGFMSAG
jgi:hypothetical protein